ncbi:MAG: CvpA family protein [Planctomycetota bacterium]|jgi:hypothetical protein
MAGLVVLLIILGCGAYQFLKGTIFKAALTVIVAIIAFTVAFGFFELAASFLIGKMSSEKYQPWAQPLCFFTIFFLTFAILQTAAIQLGKEKVDFGDLPERIGRPILGVFLGLIISGFVLTVLAMAPLPNKYPYQRFDERNPDSHSPNKVLLNVDGFVSGWFSILSNGSMRAIRNPQSFSALHPAFLDELYLNRHNDSDDVPLLSKSGALNVPSKEGVWFAPGSLKDTEGVAITPRTGCSIMVVRLVLYKNYLKTTGKFTLGQLRLICMPKDSGQDTFAGEGVNAYSIGYFSGEDEVTTKRLPELITVMRDDFPSSAPQRNIDFAFNVPNDCTPVALQFKQNMVFKVSRPVSSEQAPSVEPFVKKSPVEPGTTSPTGGDEDETYPRPGENRDASNDDTKARGLTPIGRITTGGVTDEDLNQ